LNGGASYRHGVWVRGGRTFLGHTKQPPTPLADLLLDVPPRMRLELLVTAFHRAAPLGSRLELGPQVIGGRWLSCSLLHTRPSAALCYSPVGLGQCSSSTRDEAAGARRKVLVVSARAYSVMSYDCAVTRMDGGVYTHCATHAHTQQPAQPSSSSIERTNERDRRPIGDRRSASDE
jgi:hypothetical protein